MSFAHRKNEYNNKYLSKERTIVYCSPFLFSGGKMTKELQSSRYIVISFLVREMWNRITRTLQQVKKGETNYSTVYT